MLKLKLRRFTEVSFSYAELYILGNKHPMEYATDCAPSNLSILSISTITEFYTVHAFEYFLSICLIQSSQSLRDIDALGLNEDILYINIKLWWRGNETGVEIR